MASILTSSGARLLGSNGNPIGDDIGSIPVLAGFVTEPTSGWGPVKNFSYFGGVGDDTTNNATAWNTFATFAKAEGVAGRGVVLELNGGSSFKYNHSQCQGFLRNIPWLTVRSTNTRHAIIKNTYNQSVSGGNFGYELPWGQSCTALRDASNVNMGYLVATAGIGATYVICSTVGNAANFSVGQWVLIGSIDNQYYGFPPNIEQFDFVKVTAVNAGTGRVDFDRGLNHRHRSDFPETASAGQTGPCGAARIWQLNTTGWDIGTVSWNVEHLYQYLDVRVAPTSGLIYTSLTGKRIFTDHWKGVGPSESSVGYVHHKSPEFTAGGEPDKVVGVVVYEDMTWNSPGNPLGFQSSSIDYIKIKNSTIVGGLIWGGKRLIVDNCTVDSLAAGALYGYARSALFRNSTITTGLGPLLSGSPNATIDGTTVSFSNGTIRVLKSANVGYIWNMQPGQQICLCGVSTLNVGELGIGTVSLIYEDATYYYIDVPPLNRFASLPAWATGDVRFVRNGRLSVENCTGDENIEICNYATSQGLGDWELVRRQSTHMVAANGAWAGQYGKLVSVTFNLTQASPNASTTLTLTKELYDATTVADAGSLVITFNMNTTGQRVVTTMASSLVAGDSITLGGAAQTYLPTGKVVGPSSFFWGYTNLDPSLVAANLRPVFDLIFRFDNGKLRYVTPA